MCSLLGFTSLSPPVSKICMNVLMGLNKMLLLTPVSYAFHFYNWAQWAYVTVTQKGQMGFFFFYFEKHSFGGATSPDLLLSKGVDGPIRPSSSLVCFVNGPNIHGWIHKSGPENWCWKNTCIFPAAYKVGSKAFKA